MIQSEFNRRLSLILIAITILSGFSTVNAQVLEPRSYSNIPFGMNFFIAAYGYNSGGVLFDPSIPLENANIKSMLLRWHTHVLLKCEKCWASLI